MRFPVIGKRPTQQLGAAARTVAQRTPETLTIVRDRAQPTVSTIARLASTAIFAYLVAMAIPNGNPRPVLAPLTALLVAQATLFQTIWSAVRRVAAVVVGVLLAVAFSVVVGFSWWTLGITIVVALALGYLLRLRETILEVPISAMLILSVGASEGQAASGRIVETLIGAGTGLIAGLVLASPRVESAHEAIQSICRRMADLLDQMAAGLCDGSAAASAPSWNAQSGAVAAEFGRVDEAVRQAEESVLLNPRTLLRPDEGIRLRDGLEALEHSAITIRGLTRSIGDLARLGDDHSSMTGTDERTRFAAVLRQLSAAVGDYGRLATGHDVADRELAEHELRRHLDAAKEEQDKLSLVLAANPAERPVGWPLRGELISHIDRLRNELQPVGVTVEPRPSRIRSWRLPAPVGRRRRGARAELAAQRGAGPGQRRDGGDD
jgi:hypothetical protein